MAILILGLILLLGVHSVRIFADPWRSRQIERLGLGTWKITYAVVSAVGLGLIIWGYGAARAAPITLWTPPVGMRHVAALLTVPSFLLLVAAYLPRNRLKTAVKHPMVLGVKLWALSHLLVNGTLADLVLFGSFLVWATLDFRSARRRGGAVDPAHKVAAGTAISDIAVLVLGLGAWAAFAFYLHAQLIGVHPFT